MKAIFKKDFLSLFRNVTGWIYLAVNIIFYGIYFVSNNLLAGNPSISQTVSALTLISLISTPLLTMRSIPEEKRNRTDVLLMSSPVSSKKIVLGKFFAMAAVLTIFLRFFCVYSETCLSVNPMSRCWDTGFFHLLPSLSACFSLHLQRAR